MNRTILAAALTVLLGIPLTAEAQTNDYKLKTKREIGLFLAGGALLGASAFFHPKRTCPCNPADVKGIDSSFAGDPFQSRPDTISDVLNFAVIPGTAVAFTALNARADKTGWDGFKRDSIVMAEAFVINMGATSLTKNLAHRPRPFIYGQPAGSPDLGKDDSFTSFYSGHSSNAFALGMSFATSYASRHSKRGKILAFGTAIGLATTTATLRVRARKHFPTDVLTGAGTGITIGLLVPRLHR